MAYTLLQTTLDPAAHPLPALGHGFPSDDHCLDFRTRLLNLKTADLHTRRTVATSVALMHGASVAKVGCRLVLFVVEGCRLLSIVGPVVHQCPGVRRPIRCHLVTATTPYDISNRGGSRISRTEGASSDARLTVGDGRAGWVSLV